MKHKLPDYWRNRIDRGVSYFLYSLLMFSLVLLISFVIKTGADI